MSPRAQQLLQELKQLPRQDRADLAAALVEGEEAAFDPAVEAEWAAEIKRRLDEIDSGKVKMIPGEQMLGEMEARIRARRSG